jgi:hypothetical protein
VQVDLARQVWEVFDGTEILVPVLVLRATTTFRPSSSWSPTLFRKARMRLCSAITVFALGRGDEDLDGAVCGSDVLVPDVASTTRPSGAR